MTLFHSIRTWALICVATTSAALIFFAYDKTEHLAAADWCARAIGAAKQGDRPESAINGCFSLMSKQIDALALDSHIAHGTIALALLVLVVIVLAGGQLSFRASKDGVTANVSREKEAARDVARAADEKADEIVSGLDN